MTGAGVGDGVEVDDVGVISWLIPGISERSRPNALEPPVPPEEVEPPDAAAVSPAPPDAVPLGVAVTDAGPTAYAELEEMDETGARLFCDAPLGADCIPDVAD